MNKGQWWRYAFGAFSLALVAVAAMAVFLAWVFRPSMEPGQPIAPGAFDSASVAKGAQLAAIGNCMACHTAPGGRPYAGGLALKTPFGTIYGTNITPEPDTGIGQWSEAAFARALREGVDKDGRNLYPVFPYNHFTNITDEDISALYAFVMTRESVRAERRSNSIPIPRMFVSIWNAMFFKKGVFQPNPQHSELWNRGAYLVEGLAHCSACHTPRNALGAEKYREYLSGGESEGWHAPALTGASPSPVPWTTESLQTYLRTGMADGHALTAGPMAGVTRGLAEVPEADIRAMAEYIISFDERPLERRQLQAKNVLASLSGIRDAQAANDPLMMMSGAAIYSGACASCHDRGRAAEGGALELRLASGLTLPTPKNLIRIIQDGIVPRDGEAGPWMPAYKGSLSDEQLAALVVYLRSITGEPPWKEVPDDIKRVARERE